MYRENRILAVIPARGGSKGVQRKNIRAVGGVPIVCRAGLCARDVAEIDRIVVSTDDDEIAQVAGEYGVESPFRRPPEISGDRASDWEVMNHALATMEEIDGVRYDVVILLQPTAPLRKVSDVRGTLQLLVDEQYDAVWTVTITDLKYHPVKQMHVNNGLISYVLPAGESIPARQELEPIYHVNGVAYALTRECIFGQKTRLGKNTGAYVIDGPSISIDTIEDFDKVEVILSSDPVR
jgi:CMP-N,N'-diacetyllegionaminic acid synthase